MKFKITIEWGEWGSQAAPQEGKEPEGLVNSNEKPTET